MTDFFKTIAGVLVATILYLVLAKQGKELSLLLSITACCLVFISAAGYIKPIIDFFQQLQQIGNIDNVLFEVLMKVVCVGLIGEIVTLICSDSGNTALGKSVQILTVSVIIWVSLPLLNELVSLIDTILGSI